MRGNGIVESGGKPLVSIRIHNYNYGRYLRECIESALSQTYENIEIGFSDNCSDDDSWEIALEYQKKYPSIINIAENRQTYSPDANVHNCRFGMQGKYALQLCSDDVLAPTFVEKTVAVLEDNPNCAYVMVHRGIIDDNGEYSDEPPFYDCSCIIPGEEQAAVFMMAAVNPSVSQVLYLSRLEELERVEFDKVLAGRWYGNRLIDFNLACSYPIAYIHEPLLLHRIHGANDSLEAAGNLIEIIGPYLLHQQYVETARAHSLSKVVDRLPDAIYKLSQLCLRYSTRFLIDGNEDIAEQYFHLAIALSLDIKKEENFLLMASYWDCKEPEIIEKLKGLANLVTRKISYKPPENSRRITL